MGLETAQYVEDLNPLWPLSTDKKQEGDDQLRLLKSVLQNMTASQAQVTAKDNRVWLSASSLAMDIDFTGAITKSGQGIATLGANIFTGDQALSGSSATITITPSSGSGNVAFQSALGEERGKLYWDSITDNLILLRRDGAGSTNAYVSMTSEGNVNITGLNVSLAGTNNLVNDNEIATVGANTFIATQTIKGTASSQALVLDADSGYENSIYFREGGVTSMRIWNEVANNRFRIVKFAADGVGIASSIVFDENGTINIGTGAILQGGVELATVDQLYGGYIGSGANTVHVPPGWSAVRTSQGLYTVTHNLNVAGISEIFVTANAYSWANACLHVQSIQANSFQIESRDTATQGLQDTGINFICTVRR